MTKKEFETKIFTYHQLLDDIFDQMIKDVNFYIDDNGHTSIENIERLEPTIDRIIRMGGWISDRLNGFATYPNGNNYKKSLSKKLRKILGYTY